MANVVIEVEEAEGQKEKGDHPKGKRLQHWLGPHPLDHFESVGAASDCAEVKDDMNGAQHGKGGDKIEEVHRHLAEHLSLKPETVEPSGKRVVAEVEKSWI